MLKALESFSGEGGLLPEQVWDSPDIPEKELFFGKPSGSAMPLVWAHAEYVKLVRSLEDKTVFDTPPQTVQRYIKEKHESELASWRFNHKIRSMRKGFKLRIELPAPAVVHWSGDGWKTIHDTQPEDTHFGMHIADIDASGMNQSGKILFTFYWKESDNWEGTDFSVSIDQGEIK